MNTQAAIEERFLPAAQTRARYGAVSDMWLWRRLHDDSGFPRPLVLNGRRYWRLSELVAWEKSASARQSADKATEVA